MANDDELDFSNTAASPHLNLHSILEEPAYRVENSPDSNLYGEQKPEHQSPYATAVDNDLGRVFYSATTSGRLIYAVEQGMRQIMKEVQTGIKEEITAHLDKFLTQVQEDVRGFMRWADHDHQKSFQSFNAQQVAQNAKLQKQIDTLTATVQSLQHSLTPRSSPNRTPAPPNPAPATSTPRSPVRPTFLTPFNRHNTSPDLLNINNPRWQPHINSESPSTNLTLNRPAPPLRQLLAVQPSVPTPAPFNTNSPNSASRLPGMKLANFHGRDGEDVESWIAKTELVFETYGITEEHKVNNAVLLLKGDAELFWNHLFKKNNKVKPS